MQIPSLPQLPAFPPARCEARSAAPGCHPAAACGDCSAVYAYGTASSGVLLPPAGQLLHPGALLLPAARLPHPQALLPPAVPSPRQTVLPPPALPSLLSLPQRGYRRALIKRPDCDCRARRQPCKCRRSPPPAKWYGPGIFFTGCFVSFSGAGSAASIMYLSSICPIASKSFPLLFTVRFPLSQDVSSACRAA